MIRSISKIKYIITFLTALAIMLCVSVSGSAYHEKEVFQISGKYDLDNVIFSLYQVGTWNESSEIVPVNEYADYHIDYTDNQAPQTLEAYIKRDKPTPIMQVTTDKNGTFQFSEITEGIYLITGETTQTNGNLYFPSPTLVGVSINNPTAEIMIKTTVESVKQQKDISVLKVWDDDDSQNRPSQVTVELLKDGDVYDTVQLSQNNNWQYQWKELDGSSEWRVMENTVPQDYTVHISADNNNFIITNTLSQKAIPQSTPEKLPQTGQMNLPIIILFPMGVILIIVGIIRRKHSDP